MRLRYIAIILALLCIGCSNVRNEKVTQTSLDSVGNDVKNSKLSDTDKAAFLTAIMRNAMGAGASYEGKTVGEVIDQEKQDEAADAARQQAQAAADAAAKARADAAEKAMATTVGLSVYKFTYIPEDPDWIETGGAQQDEVKFYFSGSNSSSKNVRAFEGMLTIQDSLGNKVADLKFEFTPNNDISANSTFDASKTVGASGFGEDLSRLKDTPLSRLKMTWHPSKVVFADGTSMTTGDESPEP
jgi:hypothetical protein